MKQMKKIAPEATMPLNKYIALAGICSRRKAVDIVKEGFVSVNGKIIKEPGHKVSASDAVKVKNKLLKTQEAIYILLNKPRGVVTTVSDEKGRATVLDLIQLPKNQRVYPVGRLDVNTTGVLLLTNDGDFAQKLAHPKSIVSKVYDVTVHKSFAPNIADTLSAGVGLEDGLFCVDDCLLLPSAKNNKVRVTVHSGKNRIIRRLFETLGYIVEKLDRISFAGLTKKGLALGQWRTLKKVEADRLKLLK